ncbi:hypothetical protein CTA1_3543 [Colletotrichum tanaceti]|uniref:Uncharacterized protein n=1 Tax=Colletotrichum tanaceti TaxID=1306861 RepID=A0A4U6XLR9_9PEZI|nr:hypothetical protein CTA1_3543 [Colletotrichum tanaceti]
MGWSNIDGIIQSFVRGQEHNTAIADINQTDLNQQPVLSGTGSQLANFDSSSFTGNQTWFQGMPEGDGGAASFDDLLFGFNGSVLDSIFS